MMTQWDPCRGGWEHKLMRSAIQKVGAWVTHRWYRMKLWTQFTLHPYMYSTKTRDKGLKFILLVTPVKRSIKLETNNQILIIDTSLHVMVAFPLRVVLPVRFMLSSWRSLSTYTMVPRKSSSDIWEFGLLKTESSWLLKAVLLNISSILLPCTCE